MERDRQEERLTQLLADRENRNLTFEELEELQYLEENLELGDWSLDLAAAAVYLSKIEIDEPMPAHLQAKVLANANMYFATNAIEKPDNVVSIGTKPKLSLVPNNEKPEAENVVPLPAKIVEFPFQKPRRSFFAGDFWQWSGWAVAAAACVVLAFVFWNNSTTKPIETAKIELPPAPKVLTVAEQREQLLREDANAVKLDLGEPDPKKAKGITGDVVWSNSQQKGFMRVKGLPTNDISKDTYQMWIKDANQNNPIDAGIFDVNQDGEILIPLNAKLKVVKPQLFAVTQEKAGGVVVSKLDKLMVAAKVS